ncbi:MAG: HNH endonuclease [Pseudomonas palmensis]|uniref:HNH endonuclease n=1 Tax=Pseudomonas palmensis TaxID=2815362 RepID=UPI003D0E1DBE
MAQRPQRPCRALGCRELHRNGSGYCAAHQDLAAAWGGSRRGSASERGYGSEWRRLRLLVLKRDGWICRCAECQAAGRVRNASEVDHIVPKAEGGTDHPSNLAAINPDCHKRKTQAEAARAMRRRTGA